MSGFFSQHDDQRLVLCPQHYDKRLETTPPSFISFAKGGGNEGSYARFNGRLNINAGGTVSFL
jgi:hypothetical protein